MKRRILLTIGAVLMVVAAKAGESFAYQGVLQDARGVAMGNQSPSITFRLYKEASGGSALWAGTTTVATDENGMFGVELNDSLTKGAGVGTTLAAVFAETIAKDIPLYVGLTVAGGAEIQPRQKLLAAPVASVAKSIRRAGGNFVVNGSVTFNGATTLEKKTTFTGAATVTGSAEFKTKATFEQGVSVPKGARGTMPVGTIVMWWGDLGTIPRGWALCNGSEVDVGGGVRYKTPDLRDRIPLGAGGQYPLGKTGGAPTVALTTETMPSHSHTFALDLCGAVPDFPRLGQFSGKGYGFEFEGSLNLYETQDAAQVGGNQAHDNMPPYTALYFIIRVK